MNVEDLSNPLEDIAGKREVEVECTTPRHEPDLCDWDGDTIELDEPAYLSDSGDRINLPGFSWVCPVCGNPHDFVIEGVEVSTLV